MRVGSLGTGAGGLDLACELVGWTIAWQAEVDDGCRLVLDRAWPDAPNLGDVNKTDWSVVAEVDVIVGGYPCQPFSYAGSRKGEDDSRHLWPRFADAIRVLRPRSVLLENVPGHRSLGLGSVLGDLAEMGYDATWGSIRASAVGAPHSRERLFVAAHAGDYRRLRCAQPDLDPVGPVVEAPRWGHADRHAVDRFWSEYGPALSRWERILGRPTPSPFDVGARGQPRLNLDFSEWLMGLPEGHTAPISARRDRARAIGNAVVPLAGELAIHVLFGEVAA